MNLIEVEYLSSSYLIDSLAKKKPKNNAAFSSSETGSRIWRGQQVTKI